MTELLTAAQVAAITGGSPRHVHRWATSRGISHIRRPDRRHLLYPAAAVRAAHNRETATPPQLRLARFIRNALIA